MPQVQVSPRSQSLPALAVRAAARRRLDNEPLRVIRAELFRDALVRERKRADRFDESFVLVLISFGDRLAEQRYWHEFIDALAPLTVDTDIVGWFEQRIRAALKSVEARPLTRTTADLGAAADSRHYNKTIQIPVCYEQEFGLDLEEVARRAGIEPKEVVDLHCGGDYRVHCLGFTGGFAFLGGLPKKLATPRRNVPRKEIPAGSVAIGGKQTGIYPIKSPGGWNVIGRTPLKLFDPNKNPPTFLQAGDRVRFRAITREEFERSSSLQSVAARHTT